MSKPLRNLRWRTDLPTSPHRRTSNTNNRYGFYRGLLPVVCWRQPSRFEDTRQCAHRYRRATRAALVGGHSRDRRSQRYGGPGRTESETWLCHRRLHPGTVSVWGGSLPPRAPGASRQSPEQAVVAASPPRRHCAIPGRESTGRRPRAPSGRAADPRGDFPGAGAATGNDDLVRTSNNSAIVETAQFSMATRKRPGLLMRKLDKDLRSSGWPQSKAIRADGDELEGSGILIPSGPGSALSRYPTQVARVAGILLVCTSRGISPISYIH